MRWRPVVGALLLGALVVNLAAYRHALGFTRFASGGHRPRSRDLSVAEKVQLLALGVEMPRPVNRRTPTDLGLTYERHVFPGWRGIPIEAWLVPRADARGTIVLFHGHAGSKDSQLAEARVFHDLGFNTFLVDFHGSGGSGGSDTSIGFHEATDVARACGYALHLPAVGPVILYGASMGAAAVLKGVADDGLQPAGLILECPFDSLVGTTRHRFTSLGVPSFPLAELLVFWGGVQQGFNGFQFRPAESASHIARPTLLMSGARDLWVTPDETRAIYSALRGPKALLFFEGVGHDAGLRRRPTEWRGAVSRFLEDVAPANDPELTLAR